MKETLKLIQLGALFTGAALFMVACGGQDNTTDDSSTTTTREATADTAGGDHAQHDMNTGEMAGMMGHMHRNMQEMQGMKTKVTGDPDHDFAQMMTMHHQGAIRMAEDEIANGTDAKMKEMAQKTMKTNKEDIQKLQDFTKTHKPTKGDTATTMRMMQPMGKMMDDMHKDMGDMSGKYTDQSFAQMMIHHHEMGNEMARAFLKMGKTQEMKQMAQKTINEQEKEIQELKSWLDQNKE